MKKMKSFYHCQTGQAFLVTVFIIGIVTVAVTMRLAAVSVTRVGDVISESEGEKVAYAARAGIEEILYRLNNDTDYGNGVFKTIEGKTPNNIVYIATISGDINMRIATATGMLRGYIRKSEVRLNASENAWSISLVYAAQVGEGGITMASNTEISGRDHSDGNVYSNGIIQGDNNATIKGNAWAVNGINPSSGDIIITKDAYGSIIQHCRVNGDTYSPVPPVDCNVLGSQNITPAPTPLPLVEVDLDYWRDAALAGGVIDGDYSLGGLETDSLGPKVIKGSVFLDSLAELTVTGPLWVYGVFSMSSNSKLILDEAFGENGTVILLDHPTDKANQGRLEMNSNAEVRKTSQDGYILFVSTNQSSDCSVKAAKFTSNTEAPGIVANDGCVEITSNAELVALSTRQLILGGNAEVEYDTALASALYLPGPGVGGEEAGFGWEISSWKEIP